MIDLYFYDRDGKPIPGKTPTQLLIQGKGRLSEHAYNSIVRHFAVFAEKYRLGLYESLVERFIIDPYTLLFLAVNHGVFTAVATVTPQVEKGPLHLGIVLQLDRVTNLDYFNGPQDFSENPTDRGAGLYPPQSIRELLPEHAGPPGDYYTVPGPLGRDSTLPTNTLIFQIARNGDLRTQPVARGTVQIWRIRSPGVGAIASHAADNVDWSAPSGDQPPLNVVSADYHAVAFEGDPTILGPFWLCGQELSVPLLIGRATIYSSKIPGNDALYAYGFKPASFGEAGQAQGVVFYVDPLGAVFAYDTARPGAGWQGLADAQTFEGVNLRPYGREFTTDSDSNGRVAITCYGEDRDGALSSFTVSLAPRSGGGYTFTADVRMETRPLQPTGNLAQFNKSATWDNTRTLYDDGLRRNNWLIVDSRGGVPAPTDSLTQLSANHTLYQAWRWQSTAQSSGRFEYSPQYADDYFLGGMIYQTPASSVEFTTSQTVDMDTPVWKLVRGKQVPILTIDGVTGYFGAISDRNGPNDFGPIFDATNPYPWTDIASTITVVEARDPVGASFAIYPVYGPFSAWYTVERYARITINSPVLGSAGVTYESRRNGRNDVVWVDGSPGVDGSPLTTSDVRDYTTSVSPREANVPTDPRQRTVHLTYDLHRNTLLLREQFARSGSWAYDGTQSTYIGSGVYRVRMGACDMHAELIDRREQPVTDLVSAAPWKLDYVEAFDDLDNRGSYNQVFAGFSDDNTADSDFDKPDAGFFGAVDPYNLDSPFKFENFFAFLQHYLPINNVFTETTTTGDPATPSAAAYDNDVGNFSASYNINDRGSIFFLTTAAYEALGDLEIPAVLYLFGTPYTISVDPGPWPIYRFHWADSLMNELYLMDTSRRPDTQVVDNYVWVDPRTDGYIAQAFVENNGDEARHSLVIGNADGCVPLVDVLNEWLDLQAPTSGPIGVVNPHYDAAEIIIRRESAGEVSLI